MTKRAPEKIEIFYKLGPLGHTFWSRALPGLNVWHDDRKNAFEMIVPAVSALVSAAIGRSVEYHATVSYEQFEKEVEVEGDEHQLHAAVIAEITRKRGAHHAHH
ncbi:MAG: hypothetical protein ACM31L_02515 [Actinomycetota bacterium]